MGKLLPFGRRKVDYLTADALEFRGAIIVGQIGSSTRHSVVEAVTRKVAALDQMLQHAIAFALDETKALARQLPDLHDVVALDLLLLRLCDLVAERVEL